MKRDYDHLATITKEQKAFKKKREMWALRNMDADEAAIT